MHGPAEQGLARSEEGVRHVLLVLDHAAGSDQVRPLLPGSAGCLVLVTSRRRLAALDLGFARRRGRPDRDVCAL